MLRGTAPVHFINPESVMHPTLIVPITLVLLAAISCQSIKHRKHKAQPEPAEQQPEEAIF